VGRPATRRIQEFMKLDKDYEVEIELGKRSATYDLEGPLELSDFDLRALKLSHLEDVLSTFWGTTAQMPPAFSAKKINGQKAYALARAGKSVELQPVQVTMELLSPLEWTSPHLRFKVKVSSGTYIRSLAHDVGEALGSGGLLSHLRRTRVGPFSLDAALTLPELEALIQEGAPVPFLFP
jgi:tRNA pseudouridine55 synthase